tara:strand:- start:1529 stop:1855 length:327 start_codon:yes stop_codon:yes gene_type:complete
MGISKVTDQTFEELVLKSDKPVLVKATAVWCQPCRMLKIPLAELQEELKDEITIYDLDVDENPNTAAAMGVRGIPMCNIYSGSQLKGSKVGAVSKQQLADFIKDTLAD